MCNRGRDWAECPASSLRPMYTRTHSCYHSDILVNRFIQTGQPRQTGELVTTATRDLGLIEKSQTPSKISTKIWIEN